MADFRIILSDIKGIEPSVLAANILAAHGDNYDAASGEFRVEHDESGVIVYADNIGPGDIDALASDILTDEDGTFNLRMSQKSGNNWFGRDMDDDEIES